jgi:hypothetical protein
MAVLGRFLASNPGLPVATAIAQLGYSTDPSFIRRLRDKINGKANNLGVFHGQEVHQASKAGHRRMANLLDRKAGVRLPSMRP